MLITVTRIIIVHVVLKYVRTQEIQRQRQISQKPNDFSKNVTLG